jgi:8-amino-3,8-dideoxy-alpha-D-manno-octulosonate transaminase
VPEISFRRVPEGGEDSCTFLSWFLPTAESTQAVVDEMKKQGILAGSFYWFINNWHYIRKWDHLKQALTLHAISDEQKNALLKLQDTSFAASDAVMSRCISTSISLLWTEEQVKEKGRKIAAAVQSVLGR